MDEELKTRESQGTEVDPTTEVKSPQGSYSKLSRDISENDLTNPAIGRMLLSEIDRCTRENSELTEYRDKFYTANAEAAVLRERLANVNESIGARDAFQIFGSLAVGLLPSIWNTNFFYPTAIIAIIFLGIGLFKKRKV